VIKIEGRENILDKEIKMSMSLKDCLALAMLFDQLDYDDISSRIQLSESGFKTENVSINELSKIVESMYTPFVDIIEDYDLRL
jgi:hypothetical protein